MIWASKRDGQLDAHPTRRAHLHLGKDGGAANSKVPQHKNPIFPPFCHLRAGACTRGAVRHAGATSTNKTAQFPLVVPEGRDRRAWRGVLVVGGADFPVRIVCVEPGLMRGATCVEP